MARSEASAATVCDAEEGRIADQVCLWAAEEGGGNNGTIPGAEAAAAADAAAVAAQWQVFGRGAVPALAIRGARGRHGPASRRHD